MGRVSPMGFFFTSLDFSMKAMFQEMVLSYLLSRLLKCPSTGWTKASLSLDASEENDGYSSAEEPLNSDPEDDGPKKLVSVMCAVCVTVFVRY